jgi:hypothetical protein
LGFGTSTYNFWRSIHYHRICIYLCII